MNFIVGNNLIDHFHQMLPIQSFSAELPSIYPSASYSYKPKAPEPIYKNRKYEATLIDHLSDSDAENCLQVMKGTTCLLSHLDLMSTM
jgi:hypothetical protein